MATSRIHVDTQGVGTASLMLNEEGGKYWVVARPKRGAQHLAPEYVSAYLEFDDDKPVAGYDWEGVLLTEGCLLCALQFTERMTFSNILVRFAFFFTATCAP